MDKYDVIIKPLITEKGTWQASALNAYPFEVHRAANKTEIKQAIESIYNVKVVDVRTSVRKGKPWRRGYHRGHGGDWKKAVVVLDENSRIDLF